MAGKAVKVPFVSVLSRTLPFFEGEIHPKTGCTGTELVIPVAVLIPIFDTISDPRRLVGVDFTIRSIIDPLRKELIDDRSAISKISSSVLS
jgi:hypothetical protein